MLFAVLTGQVEHGTQYQLQLVHEHTLQRTAFNFCYGPFGGVQGQCVKQSQIQTLHDLKGWEVLILCRLKCCELLCPLFKNWR